MSEIDLDYGALTIDTCIFDRHGIGLDSGYFKNLDQFRDNPVELVFPDIVHHEVLAHLKELVEGARTKICAALKASGKQDLSDQGQQDAAKNLLFGDGTDEVVALRRLQDFYLETGAKLLVAEEHVELGVLKRMYFQFIPPFEKSGTKKNEFPDAMALLTLEKWAEINDTRVLAVSQDAGWERFADSSPHIDVVGNLGDAISHFQPHRAAKSIIAGLAEIIGRNKPHLILEAVTSALQDSLGDADITVETSSIYYCEEDVIYAEYVSHNFEDDKSGNPYISVIKISSSEIVLQLVALVNCDVNCSFTLYAWDSVDKENVHMGTSEVMAEEAFQTEILVTLAGDFSVGLDGLAVVDVEVLETIGFVDFGNVEPSWDYEG